MRLQAIEEIKLKKEYTWSLHLKSFVHPWSIRLVLLQ